MLLILRCAAALAYEFANTVRRREIETGLFYFLLCQPGRREGLLTRSRTATVAQIA